MVAIDQDYTRQVRDTPHRALPLLDLAPLARGEIDRLAQQLRDVAEGIGFMCVVNHGVPDTTISDLFDQAYAFFDLPLADKVALEIDPHERGYQPLRMTVVRESDYYERPQNDFYESYNFGVDYPAEHPQVVARKRMYGSNRWPSGVPELPGAALTYLNHMGRLAKSLLPVWSRISTPGSSTIRPSLASLRMKPATVPTQIPASTRSCRQQKKPDCR